jgi:hypothetical protein
MEISNKKILELIQITSAKYNQLSLANLLITIMRRKGKENKDPYAWSNEELYAVVLSIKVELDNDKEQSFRNDFCTSENV